jgi:hypothetical protein
LSPPHQPEEILAPIVVASEEHTPRPIGSAGEFVPEADVRRTDREQGEDITKDGSEDEHFPEPMLPKDGNKFSDSDQQERKDRQGVTKNEVQTAGLGAKKSHQQHGGNPGHAIAPSKAKEVRHRISQSQKDQNERP